MNDRAIGLLEEGKRGLMDRMTLERNQILLYRDALVDSETRLRELTAASEEIEAAIQHLRESKEP